jgi:8-oxo-dGTP pyrophosphatase MutT (NUDIX family)
LKPLKIETAFSTPWFDLLAKTMQPGEAPYYSLRLPDYAAIIAITDDQRVLAVRQYRPALERYALEFPSGILDPGESPEAAALRELREETGFEAAELEPLCPMTVDNGRMTNRIWHFVARGLRRAENWVPEEGIEQLSFSLPELREAIVQGEFDHALHIAGYLQALLAGKVTLQTP